MREQGFRGNCDSQGKLGMCPSLAEPDSVGFPRRSVFNHKPQANKKFFGAAVFQKCCRGVGEQPTFAEQIKLNKLKSNKNLRENRKNRNCLQNQKVVMRDKVSGAIAIPKASWGCAPALPNRIQVVSLEELPLGKSVFRIRQKGVPPLLLPASVLQLPRCLV